MFQCLSRPRNGAQPLWFRHRSRREVELRFGQMSRNYLDGATTTWADLRAWATAETERVWPRGADPPTTATLDERVRARFFRHDGKPKGRDEL